MTRDLKLWDVLFKVGVLMALIFAVGDAQSFGMSEIQFHWAQRIATALVAAGKFGNSPLPGADDGR